MTLLVLHYRVPPPSRGPGCLPLRSAPARTYSDDR